VAVEAVAAVKVELSVDATTGSASWLAELTEESIVIRRQLTWRDSEVERAVEVEIQRAG